MPDFDAWRARHPVAAAELAALYTSPASSNSNSSEAKIQNELRLAAVADGHKLLRNNSGAGDVDGSGRIVRWGVGNDSPKLNKVYKSPDLLGPTRVTILPHHVGRVMGIATFIEAKHGNWTKATNDHERAQMNFLVDMANHGCISAFCASTDDYRRAIARFIA